MPLKFLPFRIHLLFLACAGMALTSCLGDSACKSSRSVGLNVQMVTHHGYAEVDTTLSNLIIYGLLPGYTMSADSGSASALQLPLNPSADSAAFVLKTKSGADTILLRYSREPYFISAECGFITRYHLSGLSLTGSGADTAIIIHSLVSTDGLTNIKLYY